MPSPPPYQASLDRLSDFIKRYQDIDRPFLLCPVVDSFDWREDGPSFVRILWHGTERQAIYRDGPRPFDGQQLLVIQMNHKPNSALLALPLPMRHRLRQVFMYPTYDTSGLLSPNDDEWSIIAGRKNNGHWVKRSNNPVTAGVFAAFGAGSRFRMKMRSRTYSDYFPDPPSFETEGRVVIWGYPDPQGGEAGIANVQNAFITEDDGLTWREFPHTGLMDYEQVDGIGDSMFMLVGGGTDLWHVPSGPEGTYGTWPQYLVGTIPSAWKIGPRLVFEDTLGNWRKAYLAMSCATGYQIVEIWQDNFEPGNLELEKYVVMAVYGPFVAPGGMDQPDVAEMGSAPSGSGVGGGFSSNPATSLFIWRSGPNRSQMYSTWDAALSGGSWSTIVSAGATVPAEADTKVLVDGVRHIRGLNTSAPWVSVIDPSGVTVVPHTFRRMFDDESLAVRSREAPGLVAPVFIQNPSISAGNDIGEAWIIPQPSNLSVGYQVVGNLRTQYAIVGPGLHRGGQWDYNFANGARGPKVMAAIKDQATSTYVVVEDSEYMDEDLGHRYALYPHAQMNFLEQSGSISGGTLKWFQGYEAGEW